MAIKIGINGFRHQRIGRLVFRAAMENPKVEVVGINDLFDAKQLAYMLKYDTCTARSRARSRRARGPDRQRQEHPPDGEKDPANLKWGDVGAEYVCESTGLFLEKAKAEGHIKAGAKRVVMSAPSKDDTPMFVMGVNHKSYKGEQFVS
jgi:glyceraldehyde 3-phosphate dehydrogenase